METRNAEQKDIKRLVEIKKNSLELNDFKADIEKYYRYLVKEGIAIVIVENNKIIAFIIGEKEEEFNHSFVEDMWVDEEERDRGLAWNLLEAYENECRKHNINHLTTYVREDNKKAVGVVQTGGFKKRHKYFFMEKEVSQIK